MPDFGFSILDCGLNRIQNPKSPIQNPRLLAVLHDDVPEVPPRLLVVDQADFQEPQGIPQGHRDRQGDLPLLPFLLGTASTGQFQDIAVPLDTRVLPDRSAELLGPVRKPGLGEPGLAQLPGRVARLVESLLGGIDRMGVHGGGGPHVAPARPGLLREPEVFLSHGPPVCHEDAGIDATTLQVQSVGTGPWKLAGDNVRANHDRTIPESSGFASNGYRNHHSFTYAASAA